MIFIAIFPHAKNDIVFQDEEFSFMLQTDIRPSKNDYYLHSHKDYELFCFLEGDCEFIVEGNCYQLSPGTILLMRPAEIHKLIIRSQTPYRRIVVMFSERLFSSLDQDKLLLSPYHNRPAGQSNDYRIEQFDSFLPIDLLLHTANSAPNFQLAKLKGIATVFMILAHILPIFLQRSDYTPNDPLLARIMNYIDNNLSNELSVNTLCQKFFISSSQLTRLFKMSVHLTPKEYINTKRLLLAHNLLKAGTPANRVCFLCGFNNYSTFYRAYRQQFDANPRLALSNVSDVEPTFE